METSNAPQETTIADLFVPDAPVTPQVAPSTAPVEQVPAQVTAPVVEAPKPQPTVPLPELLEQRHARQLAEQEAKFYREQVAEYRRSIEAQRPQPVPIDPVADPEGAFRALAQQNAQLAHQLQDRAVHERADRSEDFAREKFGDAKVDEAVQAAIKSGLNHHFMAQSKPYRALMDWHNGQAIAQQVGPDPAAYREKIRQEIIAEMKAGRPVPQNLPPSLSTATNAAQSVPVVTEANDFFKTMFGPKRA